MASKKRKQRKKKKSSGGGTPPPRRRDGSKALKGMAIGGGLFLAMTIFFFVRIGGETPFNHLVNLVMGDAATVAETKSDKAKVTTVKANKNGLKAANRAPNIAKSAPKSPPLEKLTEKDKTDLDKLIRARTQ